MNGDGTKMTAETGGALFLTGDGHDPALLEKIAAAGWATTSDMDDASVILADLRKCEIDALGDWSVDLPGSNKRARPVIAVIDADADPGAAERAIMAGATHFYNASGGIAMLRAVLASAVSYAALGANTSVGPDDAEKLIGERAARHWVDEALGQGGAVSVVLFAIRNLATVNAAYGRKTGDRLLRISGRRLADAADDLVGQEYIVGRLDGQHLLLAMIGDGRQAVAVTEGLVQRLDQPMDVVGQDQIAPTFCAGIARSNRRDDAVSLLRRADMVLLNAVASQVSTIVDSDAVTDRLAIVGQLETDLQQALDTDQLAIVLQPQFRCDSGALVGAEALARWRHPEFGEVGGATLFAVAERAGLIGRVSAEVQRRAIAVAAQWPDSLSDLRLSLNVTASDLANVDFTSNFLRILAQSGFSPSRLTVELVESHMLADVDRAVERLAEIRANGIRIAIDDFGTGYSNLAYLQKLPIDYLKVDSSFTRQLDGSDDDKIVVNSIINLAHSLKLGVIAEGVETEAQLAALRDHDASYFQGFLRAGPLEPEEFLDLALR